MLNCCILLYGVYMYMSIKSIHLQNKSGQGYGDKGGQDE